MELLWRQLWLSEQESGRLSLVVGPHMSGKSVLIREVFKGKRYIYVRMSGKSESLVMDEIAFQIRKVFNRAVPPSASTVRDIFDFIFAEAGASPFTLIIDSVDEIVRRNPVFFEYLAKKWKKHRRKVNINLVMTAVNRITASEIFDSPQSDFHGCADLRVDMSFLTPSEMKSMLDSESLSYGKEDLLALYMVTGGCPGFFTDAIANGAVSRDAVFAYFLSESSLYVKEVSSVLSVVLGRGNDIYVSILQMLARGVRTQSEIEDKLGMIVGGHLAKLEKEYRLIAKARPLLADKTSRNKVRFYIKDQYLDFWMRYVEGNRPAVEMGDMDSVVSIVKEDFRAYGRQVLCRYFSERFREDAVAPEIGGDWIYGSPAAAAEPHGKLPQRHDPIDIIAMDSKKRKALVVAVDFDSDGFDKSPLLQRAEALRKSWLYGFSIDRRLFTLSDM